MEGSWKAGPFGSLEIWRAKLERDLETEPALQTDGSRLRLLLEQGKDVEEAVQGCLQRSLWDLWGCVGWGLLDRSFAEEQERCLYDQAAAELLADKRLCLQLAREHGLGEEYARSVRKQEHHTVGDYERCGDLRFALLVWNANLKRDALLAVDADHEAVLCDAAAAVADLITRSVANSASYYRGAAAPGAPTATVQEEVRQRAAARARLSLEEVGTELGLAPSCAQHAITQHLMV